MASPGRFVPWINRTSRLYNFGRTPLSLKHHQRYVWPAATFDSGLNFSTEAQRIARARRVNMLRARRIEKKITHTDPHTMSPMILEYQPQEFDSLFEEWAPKHRMLLLERDVQKLQALCMQSQSAGPPAASPTKVNGSATASLTPRALFPELRELARKKTTLALLVNYLLSDRSEATLRYTVRKTDDEAIADAMEDILVLAREKLHQQGTKWAPHPTPKKGSKNDVKPMDSKRAREAARVLWRHIQRNLPAEKNKSLRILFTKCAQEEKNAVPVLSKLIYTRTAAHFHLVAAEIAKFFAFPDMKTKSVMDAQYLESKAEWEALKGQFVECFLNIQSSLRREMDSTKTEVKTEVALPQKVVDLPDRPYEVAGQPYFPDSMTLGEAPARFMHLVFEVLPRTNSTVESMPSPLRNMVFVDNLPIDITEDALTKMYSRCGAIASVEIFQQRPDLDPGPPAKLELEKQRKLKANKTRVSASWKRKRGPVHALIDFVDEKGYQRATDDSLRLFGMVVNYHDVRSIPAHKITSLFVEDVSDNMDSRMFESQYSCILNETVCLRSGQSSEAHMTSGELRFPSFADAYRAFAILRRESGASIQWMRTPKNAHDWWTRKQVA